MKKIATLVEKFDNGMWLYKLSCPIVATTINMFRGKSRRTQFLADYVLVGDELVADNPETNMFPSNLYGHCTGLFINEAIVEGSLDRSKSFGQIGFIIEPTEEEILNELAEDIMHGEWIHLE